jgi:UV DNA damage endonuclease
MDLMGLPQSTEYPINIHLGGAYGDKESSMIRFCENFKSLSESAKKRLIVENDDKASMFSVKDLYEGVYSRIGIPIRLIIITIVFVPGVLLKKRL